MNRRRALLKLVLVSAAMAAAMLATVAATAPQHAAEVKGQRGMLWVANRTLNNVAVYDVRSGALLGTVHIGREPNSMFVPRGTGKA